MAYKSKQMIVVRRDLKMRKGKIAAQASHGSVEAVLAALVREGRMGDLFVNASGTRMELAHDEGDTSALTDWFDSGIAKVCVYVDSEEELLELARQGQERGFIYSLVRDAGLTEFGGVPTYTALVFEPLHADDIDPLTGELPLY